MWVACRSWSGAIQDESSVIWAGRTSWLHAPNTWKKRTCARSIPGWGEHCVWRSSPNSPRIGLDKCRVENQIFDMALTPSTMLPLGTSAPDFHLPDTNEKTV